MKYPQDFKNRAIKKGIKKWIIHYCSICGYPCGFHFSPDGETVLYNNGCYCTREYNEIASSWVEVADHYNNNAGSPDAEERVKKNPLFGNVIKEMNDFWGFENPDFLKEKEKEK